jgi:Helix-turn-helix domain
MDTNSFNSAGTTQEHLKLAVLAVCRVEAARLLSVHPNTIDRLVSRGLLKPSRATRRPLFAVRELEDFLARTKGSLE